MTQAHKTPGNKVVFKPSLFDQAWFVSLYGGFKDTTFEVADGHGFHPSDNAHMTIKNLETGVIMGCDPEWLQSK